MPVGGMQYLPTNFWQCQTLKTSQVRKQLKYPLGFWILFCSYLFWLLGERNKRKQWKADTYSTFHMFWIKQKSYYYSIIKNVTVSALRIKLQKASDYKTSTYHNLHFSPKFFQFSHRLKPPVSAFQIPLALKPELPNPLKFDLQDKNTWLCKSFICH